MNRKRLLLGLAIVAVLAYGAWQTWGPANVPAGQPPLVALTAENVAEFRGAFNAASGETRLVVLLSPT